MKYRKGKNWFVYGPKGHAKVCFSQYTYILCEKAYSPSNRRNECYYTRLQKVLGFIFDRARAFSNEIPSVEISFLCTRTYKILIWEQTFTISFLFYFILCTDSGALHIIAKFELKALYSDRQFTIGLSICHISYNLQCNNVF